MKYRVTETQVVTYTWETEADSPDEAEESSEYGVPDDAVERLVSSDTEVVAL
jgi:hypothetical protein